MLAAGELLTALAASEDAGMDYKNDNDDSDFGRILDFYGLESDKTGEKTVRYSDGTEGSF